MDAAVALVEGYLHINGYLTATEYPVVEKLSKTNYRAITDVDILAVRLPGAGRILPQRGKDTTTLLRAFEPDPQLVDDETDNLTDFLICEVKEGVAELNRSARSPETLITAIRRFTMVEPDAAHQVAEDLRHKGRALLPHRNVQVRLMVFGSRMDEHPPNCKVILHRHCIAYMAKIAKLQEPLAGAMHIKNPTLNLLAILAKSGISIEPCAE